MDFKVDIRSQAPPLCLHSQLEESEQLFLTTRTVSPVPDQPGQATMYLSFACCESKGTFLRQERRKCLKICLVEFLCVADVAGWIQVRATAGQVFLQTSSWKSRFLGLSYVQSPAEFRGSRNLAFSCPWSSISDVYWWISAQVPSFQQSAYISCDCSTLESALRTTV